MRPPKSLTVYGMWTVRTMTEADIPEVSTIRVTGWQAAYAGILPRSYLDGMTVEADVRARRGYFEQPKGDIANLVAVNAQGAVVGWACIGPDRDTGHAASATPTAAASGELYALYVQPTLTGSGIGRTLLDAAHTHAVAQGFEELRLWVLTDNTRARRFYERAGYAADGAVQADEYDGVSVSEVRYRRTPLVKPQAA